MHRARTVEQRRRTPGPKCELSRLGELAAGMAHELHQPLSIIAMVARNVEELLALKNVDPVLIRDKMEQVLRNVLRARQITASLEIFAQGAASPPVAFDPVPMLRQAVATIAEDAKAADIETSLALADRPPRLLGQPGLVELLFANLLSNALYAVRRVEPGKARWIRLSLERLPAGRARITVADSGGGIPPALLRRVFEPFFTTKPAGEGTGIGLVLALEAVRHMGGELHAVNGPEGLVVTAELPAAENAA